MAKLFAAISGTGTELILERATPAGAWSLTGTDADVVRTGPAQFSVLVNGQSHRVLVLKEDKENRIVRLRVGARTCTVKLEEEQDRLMQTLGLDKAARKAGDLKAPMPGLVLNVLVKPGDRVKKNDPVLVLEAMKMENELRATTAGVVAEIRSAAGRAVEKGQVLVEFAPGAGA